MTCSAKRGVLCDLDNLSCPQQQENGMVRVLVARCVLESPKKGCWLLGGCNQSIIPFAENTSYSEIKFCVMVFGQC